MTNWLKKLFSEKPPTAKDPVCGMGVNPKTSPHKTSYKGTRYVFCSASCKNQFVQDPANFVH